jgi:riboflavin transporter FmnP
MNKGSKMSLNVMIKVSLLSVIALILMVLQIGIPVFPGFLKIDLSDLPAMIAGFAFGPLAGVLVELLKNILHLMRTTSGGVGELANFLVGSAFVAPAAIVYLKNKTKKGAIIGLVVGTLGMVIMGVLANKFIILPFYAKIMPLQAIIDMSAMANPSIVDINSLILFGIAPFNLLKGMLVSVVTILIYKYVHRLLVGTK